MHRSTRAVMLLAERRVYALRHWDAIGREFSDAVLRRAPVAEQRPTRVLLTTPNEAMDPSIADGLRDPFSGQIAALTHGALAARGVASTVISPFLHRSRCDQNRIRGLVLGGDMVAELHRYGHLGEPWLHIDVHSFSSDAPQLPAGWGRGVNIITLHGDRAQLQTARRMQQIFCAHVPSAPAAHVVPMDRYPTTDTDGDSNAQTEWSRSRGMMGLLVELPVEANGRGHCADDSCWLSAHASAAAYAEALAAFCADALRTPAGGAGRERCWSETRSPRDG
jgi:hypothetical protein